MNLGVLPCGKIHHCWFCNKITIQRKHAHRCVSRIIINFTWAHFHMFERRKKWGKYLCSDELVHENKNMWNEIDRGSIHDVSMRVCRLLYLYTHHKSLKIIFAYKRISGWNLNELTARDSKTSHDTWMLHTYSQNVDDKYVACDKIIAGTKKNRNEKL